MVMSHLKIVSNGVISIRPAISRWFI